MHPPHRALRPGNGKAVLYEAGIQSMLGKFTLAKCPGERAAGIFEGRWLDHLRFVKRRLFEQHLLSLWLWHYENESAELKQPAWMLNQYFVAWKMQASPGEQRRNCKE